MDSNIVMGKDRQRRKGKRENGKSKFKSDIRNTHKPTGSVREKVGKGREKWMGKKGKLRIKRVKRWKADLHMYSSAEEKYIILQGRELFLGCLIRPPVKRCVKRAGHKDDWHTE